MRTTKDYVFFWDGVYSQWHRSPFKERGTIYSCAEQYMMHKKALFFKDDEIATQIMSTLNPRDQKSLGRSVRNFDANMWDQICEDIVYVGSYLKFTQNPRMLKDLMETENRTIVEASPYDVIWGIGLHETDPRCLDEKLWRGKNLLGKILTNLRDDLKSSRKNFYDDK